MTPRMVPITCHCTLKKLGKKGQFVCNLVKKNSGGGHVSSFKRGRPLAWGGGAGKGLKDQRHSTRLNYAWNKKFGAMAPAPLSFKTRGGGGGWGVSHTKTGPGRPPPPPCAHSCAEGSTRSLCVVGCVWIPLHSHDHRSAPHRFHCQDPSGGSKECTMSASLRTS